MIIVHVSVTFLAV